MVITMTLMTKMTKRNYDNESLIIIITSSSFIPGVISNIPLPKSTMFEHLPCPPQLKAIVVWWVVLLGRGTPPLPPMPIQGQPGGSDSECRGYFEPVRNPREFNI